MWLGLRLPSTTDGRNKKTQQTYDALNRVAKIIDPALKETQFTYDSQNRIKTVTDARGNTTTYNYDGLGNLLSQTSPDTGTSTFTYDAAGNRTSAKDARNIIVNYTYDALNRLTSVTYPASTTENITYTYDSTANGSYGIGRLASVTNAASTQSYSYNHLGLITQKRVTLNSVASTIQYNYDTSGNLTSMVYPSGRIVTYTLDTAGRVQAITTKANATATEQSILSAVAYMPFGPAKSFTFGNGLSHTMTFDNDYRITAIQVGGVLNRNYAYDNADNITGIADGVSTTKSQTFTYDDNNRLSSAAGVYGNQLFSYDAVGNRTGLMSDSGAVNATVTFDDYSYESTSNRLTSIAKKVGGVASGTRSFTYDAAGNRIQGTAEDNKIQNTTFNNANRLTTAKVNNSLVGTYTYNDLGQRVSKVAGSTQEFYHYNEAGQLIAVNNATGQAVREYIYNGDQLVGFVNYTGGVSIPSITLTAPQATLQNAALATAQTGYTATAGYIAFTGEGSATWTSNITYAANYNITLRYSLAAANRPLTVWVDGVQVATANFTSTADWNTWATLYVPLGSLTPGSHTIAVKTAGSGGPNLDQEKILPVAGQNGPATATIYYVHNDHHSTPQVLTAQNKSVVFMADYQPFGKLNPGQANNIELYSRFPGQMIDTETGLYYNYFRDYDPSIGRYIESDPIGLDGGINTFAYVGGNPLSRIDPLGLEWVTIKGKDGSGNNTVVCWMGKAYYLLDDPDNKQYKCPAINACLAEHEKNHIKDALREKPGLCVGVRGNRTAFSNDVASLKVATELNAFEREKTCLSQKNDECDETCKKDIESRLKAIERSIKRVKNGTY